MDIMLQSKPCQHWKRVFQARSQSKGWGGVRLLLSKPPHGTAMGPGHQSCRKLGTSDQGSHNFCTSAAHFCIRFATTYINGNMAHGIRYCYHHSP